MDVFFATELHDSKLIESYPIFQNRFLHYPSKINLLVLTKFPDIGYNFHPFTSFLSYFISVGISQDIFTYLKRYIR